MKRLVTLALAAGFAAATAHTAAPGSTPPAAMPGMKMAPAHLIVGGRYSDVRFIDMTVPHHLMAIAMAKVELRLGTKAPLQRMAREMITEQQKEISELRAMRKQLTGSSATATRMNPHTMAETGMPSPAKLAREKPTDLAFIDAMVPHHSSLIPLANIVLRRSSDTALKQMARKMMDSQAGQVAEMIKMREEWYGALQSAQP